ncbi:tyrosine-protein phosphatase [Nocardia thailandica]|uniref:tyrosine-protein phosphatase n=1 Tax=Nocardia thailandica TaxID=257275 RepID=UPI0002D6AB6B|nr:tyrosine-protein phosphatase [Nocardia thailandica]
MFLTPRRATVALALCAGLVISPLSGAAVAAPGPVLTSPARGADAPRLASADNFRDIAGTGAGYGAQGSHRLNKGVIYRSNALTLSDADLATVEGLGIAEVLDLRNDGEIASAPDRVPAGAAYVNIQILAGDVAEQAGRLRSPEEAKELLRTFNRQFVTEPQAREGMARTLTRIAEQPGPIVFHCTAGKDRTGWVAYLLQSLVGVDADTIMRDYLLTNEYSAASIEATVAHITATRGPEAAAVFRPLLGVDRSYLEAGITQLVQDYGTVDKYLRDGLGLRPQVLSALRAKLVK